MTRRAGWWAFVVVCLVVALVQAGAVTLRTMRQTAREDERARLSAESAAWTAGQLAIQRAYFVRQVDSLRGALAAADSALGARITRARRDTLWMPADTAPAVRLVACRAQLDTLATACDRFRAQAAAVLEGVQAAADSVRAADSAAVARASMLRAAALAARDDAARQLAAVQRGRTRERGACAVSGALNVFTLWRLTK